MTDTASSTEDVISEAQRLFEESRWAEGYELLRSRISDTADPAERLRLKLELVAGYSEEDWTRGLTNRDVKNALLNEIDAELAELPDPALRACALYERGMALHIGFIMDEGDQERELECFTEAAELYQAVGDAEGACLSTAMIGIFHHVDRLDRETAEPILKRAYEMAPPGVPSYGRSEATRHLGQIRQERGDPAGAIPLLQESLEDRVNLGSTLHMAPALHALGFAKFEAGDVDGAKADIARAREIAERAGSRFWLAMMARTEADIEFSSMLAPELWRRSHP